MNIETLIKTDPALYADMDAYLRSGEWQVEYDSPTALWLRWNRGWLHAIAAFDRDEARRLLSAIPKRDAVVLRGFDGLNETAAACGFLGCNPCKQVVYEKTAPIPVCTALEIRRPDERDYEKVAQSYHMGTEEELRNDFQGPDFLGGYIDGEMAGYIGVHSDGSMGMLYVFPPFRRKGYGEALYATLINRRLNKEHPPFAQILADNQSSLKLQQKLGFRMSEGLVYWMWHTD